MLIKPELHFPLESIRVKTGLKDGLSILNEELG